MRVSKNAETSGSIEFMFILLLLQRLLALSLFFYQLTYKKTIQSPIISFTLWITRAAAIGAAFTYSPPEFYNLKRMTLIWGLIDLFQSILLFPTDLWTQHLIAEACKADNQVGGDDLNTTLNEEEVEQEDKK